MKLLSKRKNIFKYILIFSLIIFSLTGVLNLSAAQQGKVINVEPDSRLNVRSAPGTGNSIVGYLHRDNIVTIKGNGKDSNGTLWYNVSNGSVTGYVRHDFIQLISTPTATPKPTSKPTAAPTNKPAATAKPVVDFEAMLSKENFPKSI